MEILIKRLTKEAKLPVYNGDVGPGIDLYASAEVTIHPGERVAVPTGIAVAMPVGYVGLIWHQESIAVGEPLQVAGAMVDSGYREEINVLLTNTGAEPKTFVVGERVAQMLIQHIHHPQLIEAEDLSPEV